MRNFVLGLILFLPAFSWSHVRLTSPAPRSSNSGIKTGPCGGLAPTTPTTLTAGSTVVVKWEETINHPGKFIFSFSQANDQNFTTLKTVTDGLNDTNLPHLYSTTIVVPSTPCEACTLQLIQSMEENPAAPTYYYSCADIKIVSAAPAPTPEPSNPNPNPTPTPLPPPGPTPMPPPDPGAAIQSASPASPMQRTYPEFKSGCGMIRASSESSTDLAIYLWLLTPLIFIGVLRTMDPATHSF